MVKTTNETHQKDYIFYEELKEHPNLAPKCSQNSSWYSRYCKEVRESVVRYEKINKKAKVTTRKITEEEKRIYEMHNSDCHKLKL